MASMTPPQTRIIMPWIFGSATLGTLRAREIVAKARMPSVQELGCFHSGREVGDQHTHGSDNLCFQTELVLETASKVGETTLAVTRDIRNLPDVVEHVARSEEQNGNEGDGGPEVTVLEDGKEIWASDGSEGDEAKDRDGADDQLLPVEGTLEVRGWRIGKMAREPIVDRLSLVDTARTVNLSWSCLLEIKK